MSTEAKNPKAYFIYINWYTKPPNERNPATLEQLATILNITLSDIAEFQSRDSFYDDLYKEARNWGRSKIPELLHTLYAEFKSSKKPAILETYKKLLEVDKKEGGNTFIFNALEPTDKQYRQIVTREAGFLKNSSKESSVELLSADR